MAVLRSELGRDAERPERGGETLVNGAVALLQRPEYGDRRGDCIRDFLLVPNGAATGGAAHHVPPAPLDLGAIVARQRGLIAAERKTGGRPEVQPQSRMAGASG